MMNGKLVSLICALVAGEEKGSGPRKNRVGGPERMEWVEGGEEEDKIKSERISGDGVTRLWEDNGKRDWLSI
jgi:hypothetical protein